MVGQRLVRRLHKESRQNYVPSAEEVDSIVKLFGLTNAPESFRIIHELEKRAAKAGLGGDTPLSTSPTGITSLWRADANTNTEEVQEGYRGRMGIYEVLNNTPAIKNLIMTRATSDQIHRQGIKDGMLSMQIDGLIKALRGETTIEEVLRVNRDRQ